MHTEYKVHSCLVYGGGSDDDTIMIVTMKSRKKKTIVLKKKGRRWRMRYLSLSTKCTAALCKEGVHSEEDADQKEKER